MDYVVATDGSEHSEHALRHAVELATATGGRLTIVHAVDPSVVEAGGGTSPIGGFADATDTLLREDPEDAEERGERVLENAAALAEELGVEADTELLFGDPVGAIAEYLDGDDVTADGVVVGHRGLSERAEAAMGSVAKSLIERVDVPVTVVT